jgi:uncharacterized membrane protein
VGGALVLAVAAWAIHLGQADSYRAFRVTGLALFGLEVLYLYIRTFGTLLDTALAFLIGGILFIALAFILYRLDKQLAQTAGEAAA